MTAGHDHVRDLVLELWTRTRMDWGFATDRIAEAFRRDRRLGSRERRDVAETLYGLIRSARRVDFALEALGHKPARREVAQYLAHRVLAGAVTPEQAAAEVPGDWAAVAAVDERIAHERGATRRFGLTHSLPDWLAARLLAEYGDSAAPLAEALNRRAPLTVRANTLKITRDALADRLRTDGLEARPTPYARSGLILETRVNVFGLDAFREGLFEVQDEASQLVAELCAPPPKGLVVDACAGAGGKTLALGALLENRGRLLAFDVDGRKLEELRRRARRAGLSNLRAAPLDGEDDPGELWDSLAGQADRVLVDAPCSGLGALRRNPEARWRLALDDLARLARKQEAIARRAMALVAPGGRLIYATCTILAEENEAVVEKLRAGPPEGTVWEPFRPAEIWGGERARWVQDESGQFLKMLPHRHDTDGFFAAVLRRTR